MALAARLASRSRLWTREPAETELAICTGARAAKPSISQTDVRLGLQSGTREIALRAVDTHRPLDDLMEG